MGGWACAGVAPSPARTAPSRLVCPTGYAVTVHNNATVAVDVWQHNVGGDEVVGTVEAGVLRDLPLTGDGEVTWRYPPENPPRFHGDADVNLRVHCRT